MGLDPRPKGRVPIGTDRIAADMLRNDPAHENRRIIEDDIAHAKRILEVIRKAIPD